jgi:two-component system sensor histidine kinase PilS (NtrC family)
MTEPKDTALALAELAHELRQPLTAIRTSAELLLEAQPGDAAVAARAAVILREAERARIICERALRQKPPGAVRADLNLAIESAWALFEPEAEKQGAVLERDLSPALAPVAAEQIALEQIFTNLLRNALEAVAGKGGRIKVRTSATAGGAEALVEDDGPGIPAELRARLFSPFATGREKGTGLGLRISRALAEEAGGTLEAAEGGPGARFRLRLPFAT